MANFFVQELILERHFMLIDSPIPFELVANPTNFIRNVDYSVRDASKVTGRDICSRPAGAWRVDCFKLLSENYHKNNPVFTMLIKYDMDLLHEGETVDIRYSDIDIGEGIAGVNGQLVNISPSDFIPIINVINDTTSEIVGALGDSGSEIVGAVNSVVTAQNASNTLLEAVKNAVLEVNNGSVNNKLEQIRTVLKSSISTPSPFADLRTAINSVKDVVKYRDDYTSASWVNDFRNFGFVGSVYRAECLTTFSFYDSSFDRYDNISINKGQFIRFTIIASDRVIFVVSPKESEGSFDTYNKTYTSCNWNGALTVVHL